jgi:hypothetical protein
MAGLGDADDMQAFVDEFSLRFPQAVSGDGSLWARFGVPYQPAWAFVDDDGRVRVIQGVIPPEDLRRILDELVSS